MKNFIIIKDATVIRQNFNTCLKNYAFIWYISQLTNFKKKVLRTMKSVVDDKKRWIIQLKKKFRFIHSNALNNFFKKKYRVSNVRNHREFVEYMFNIMNHSKNADFHNVFNQLTFAYKKIDVEFKQALKASTPNITIKKFMNQLKKRKVIWWKLYNGRFQHIDFSFSVKQQSSNQYRNLTTFVDNYNYNNNSFWQNQQRFENYQSSSNSFNFQSKNRVYFITQYQNANYNQPRNQSTFENVGEYQAYRFSFQLQQSIDQKQIIDDSIENQSSVDQKNAYDSSNVKNYSSNQNQNVYRSYQSQNDY